VQKVFFGPITNEENRNVKEIAWNEIAAMVPLVVLMVWIGVHPNTFLRKMTPSVQQLLTTVQNRGGAVMLTDAAICHPERSEGPGGSGGAQILPPRSLAYARDDKGAR